MNNKGQSLVLFIISIPIFIILTAFVVEGFIIATQKVHLSSLTKTILKNNIEQPDDDIIKQTYKKNGIDDKINIQNDNGLQISFSHEVDSFFGKVINKNKYIIHINLKATKSEDKIKIEKGT